MNCFRVSRPGFAGLAWALALLCVGRSVALSGVLREAEEEVDNASVRARAGLQPNANQKTLRLWP